MTAACPHGEPRGERYCALCRRGLPAEPARDTARTDRRPFDPHAGALLVRNAITAHTRTERSHP